MPNLLTKAELQSYTGYNTSSIDDGYFTFLDGATLDWINTMTGQSYTDTTAPQAIKLLALMLMGEVFRARQRLGAEASEVNLDGVKTTYQELSARENIKRLLDAHRKIIA